AASRMKRRVSGPMRTFTVTGPPMERTPGGRRSSTVRVMPARASLMFTSAVETASIFSRTSIGPARVTRGGGTPTRVGRTGTVSRAAPGRPGKMTCRVPSLTENHNPAAMARESRKSSQRSPAMVLNRPRMLASFGRTPPRPPVGRPHRMRAEEAEQVDLEFFLREPSPQFALPGHGDHTRLRGDDHGHGVGLLGDADR